MEKIIFRADDIGYTQAFNDGAFKAMDKGVVTSADLMLDCPASLDAMVRLRERPWISVGWHCHMWGWPVLPKEQVPSMVNETGRFKFRHDPGLKNTCDYTEICNELHAELERCKEVLGHVPTYAWRPGGNGVFDQAFVKMCEEYNIILDWASKPDREGKLVPAKEPYAALDIYMPNQPAGYYKRCYAPTIAERNTYNPVQYFKEDYDHIMGHKIGLTAWHPGYLDDFIMSESSLHEGRVVDVIALTSDELKQWIKDNHLVLVNTTDALFGTNVYQEHLKETGSPLFAEL